MAFRPAAVLGLILSACVFALAQAQTPKPWPLRLAGEAPTAADPAPKTFVIDAVVTPGDSDSQSTIDGWFSAAAAPASSGEVTGTCVEQHCTVTASLDDAKLELTGDFGAASGPVAARFVLKDNDDKTTATGAATLQPLAGPVAGQGPLAAPDVVTAAGLDELLMWNQQTVASGSPPGDDPPSSTEREELASWQQSQGRLATGLIFPPDLARLKVGEQAARRAAGWTTIGDPGRGWSAGYPAALLPAVSHAGGEQRFASPDGKAVLVVAIDPPMNSEAFDAFFEQVSADRPGRNNVETVRTNGDVEMRFEEGGVATVAAYHNRDGGLARLVFTYPTARADTFQPFDVILQRGLTVTDDLKP